MRWVRWETECRERPLDWAMQRSALGSGNREVAEMEEKKAAENEIMMGCVMSEKIFCMTYAIL
jgi:hypothetical protein